MSEQKAGKRLSIGVKVAIGAVAALALVATVAVAHITTSAAGQRDEEPVKGEQSVEDYDPGDDGNIEQEFVIDSDAIVSMTIYEARAMDLRITATRAAAGIGGGEIDLRIANEADRDYVVEFSDMTVAGEGVSGSGEFEVAAMQIAPYSVSFKGAQVQEVDDLDLWHATVTIKTTDGDVVETGTTSLAGAFDE